MYRRLLHYPLELGHSFFLFGPRGTGKTTWLRRHFPNALYLDLLNTEIYIDLSGNPGRLEQLIIDTPADWVILDEVQRIPILLNEVHRLIEEKRVRFILTGSSARSLRRKGVNLLAGRALVFWMFPLTAEELGEAFSLDHALNYGHLPATFSEPDLSAYLHAYVSTYLREEVLQEGLTRNLTAFTRFLEAASFSQGSPLNITGIAREVGLGRKTADGYFQILEDLLLATRLSVFTKRAKRRLVQHSKFYFFDVGVYRALRPMGPADRPEEAEGIALETLVLQEIRATNDYHNLGYHIYYWRTSNGLEVDFVVYGERGLTGIEVKRSANISKNALSGLLALKRDYPYATLYCFYGGKQRRREGEVTLIPTSQALRELPKILNKS